MPMPQYNGPMYAQGPTAVGPYNLQGYQPTFGYNPQQTYMPQTPQPVPSQEPMAIPHLIGRSISANDQIPPKEIPSDGSPAYFPMQDGRRDHVEGRHSRATQAHQGESHQVVDHVDRLMRR